MLVLATGGVLIYGTLDMPRYGDANAPINQHVANRYIEKSGHEVGPPNVVTSVLASYRGYDTLGETAVVFTAAVGVLMIIGRSKGGFLPGSTQIIRHRRRKGERPDEEKEASS